MLIVAYVDIFRGLFFGEIGGYKRFKPGKTFVHLYAGITQWSGESSLIEVAKCTIPAALLRDRAEKR